MNSLLSNKKDTCSTTDYYPFGQPLPDRSFSGESYKFGMNGQMKEIELSEQDGSFTTAQFWEYDSRAGRRWNLDPKPQIFISDYACFGNNPVGNTDFFGNEFVTPGDKEKADYTENEATNKKEFLKQKLNGKLSKAERSDIEQSIADLDKTISEIREMRESPTKFTFSKVGSDGSGGFSLDDFGVITIQYTDFYSMVHELKHSYQFMKGDITFQIGEDGKIKFSGATSDITDEVQAYQRDYSFGNRDKFNSFSNITKDNVRSLVDPVSGKQTYLGLPNGALNYLSTVSDYNTAIQYSGNTDPAVKSTKHFMICIYPQYVAKDVMSNSVLQIINPSLLLYKTNNNTK